MSEGKKKVDNKKTIYPAALAVLDRHDGQIETNDRYARCSRSVILVNREYAAGSACRAPAVLPRRPVRASVERTIIPSSPGI